MKEKFYITTAIAYPNGKPHMGHALEIIQTDCIARFYKMCGYDVEFQTGTDEHGIKNWQTAKEQGKDVLEFLDENVSVFKELYDKLNICYNTFIRTSDKKMHYPGAQKLWNKLEEKGDIYKKSYKGLYCVGCESYKTKKELIDNKCPNHPTREIEEIEEENYFFKLSKYKDQISELISKDEYKIVPNTRKNEILSFLKDAKDISFSRKKEALPWGVPVPNDSEHVMYVWCDALSNYITGQGYGRDDENFKKVWPANIHVIGKDILRFHAAFWPAMLLSADIELPKELFVHGFVLSEGAKMGKSTGNIIEPFYQIDKYGVDPFRFFLLGSMPIDGDGDYSERTILERINNELVANFSNFAYRVLSFTKKQFDGEIKGFDENSSIIKEIEDKFDLVKNAFEKREIKLALSYIMEISAIGNKYFQEQEPWKNKESAQEVMALCINILKNLSILINPIMPSLSEKLASQIGIDEIKWSNLGFNLKNHKINEAEILVKRIDIDNIEEREEKDFRKVSLTVDDEVKELGINVISCCIKGINVKKNHSGLKKLKKEESQNIDYNEKILSGYEDIYQKIGLDDKKTPIRNLINFIKEKGKLPDINTVVDSYNIVSAKNNISVGCHDINKMNGDARFSITKGNEDFFAMNSKDKWNVQKGIFSCFDDDGIICYADLKQCDRTKVDENTENIFLYVEGNSKTDDKYIKESLSEICKIITKFCDGEIVE